MRGNTSEAVATWNVNLSAMPLPCHTAATADERHLDTESTSRQLTVEAVGAVRAFVEQRIEQARQHRRVGRSVNQLSRGNTGRTLTIVYPSLNKRAPESESLPSSRTSERDRACWIVFG